jgi:CubicO group peptidase (beta-lactamase class C family)
MTSLPRTLGLRDLILLQFVSGLNSRSFAVDRAASDEGRPGTELGTNHSTEETNMQIRDSMSMRRLLSALSLILGLCSLVMAQPPAAPNKALPTAINEVLEKTFKSDEPGAAVIVVRDGKVVFRKGYGKANLELGVPVEPDMVFRLGSITKQFTAVATLMLAEQGKLSLDDDITKFLPDYPTKGQRITIEHLLTHTSGIKSYTSLPEWLALWRKDLTVKEIIDLFKNQPMDFAPGERWSYSNSGYILLGAIIEKVSGQTYQEFVEKNIFAPLGMKHSYYDVTVRLIPRRVVGYSKANEGYQNAAYLSMTQPFSAGALMSSVDDLALWDAALYTEKLVKQQSLKRAWTPRLLNNGKSTHYGYGWSMSTYEGHPIIEHSGGVNGFATDALRMPADRIFVAILTNKDSMSPGAVAFEVAALAIGKPYQEPAAIKLTASQLDQYVGVYQLDEKEEVIIRRDGEKLFANLPGGGRAEIIPSSETQFFIRDSLTRLSFSKNTAGVTALVVHDRYGTDQVATKTDKPLPAPRKEVAVDAAIYEAYVGEYEIAPNFTITISKDGSKLMAQATGQPKLELFPESQTKFFVKEASVQIEFVVDGSGKATSLVVYQAGQSLPAKKVK